MFEIGDAVILKTPDRPETQVIFRGYLSNGMAIVFDPLSGNVDTVPPARLSQIPPEEYHYSTPDEHGIPEHRMGDWS